MLCVSSEQQTFCRGYSRKSTIWHLFKLRTKNLGLIMNIQMLKTTKLRSSRTNKPLKWTWCAETDSLRNHKPLWHWMTHRYRRVLSQIYKPGFIEEISVYIHPNKTLQISLSLLVLPRHFCQHQISDESCPRCFCKRGERNNLTIEDIF